MVSDYIKSETNFVSYISVRNSGVKLIEFTWNKPVPHVLIDADATADKKVIVLIIFWVKQLFLFFYIITVTLLLMQFS